MPSRFLSRYGLIIDQSIDRNEEAWANEENRHDQHQVHLVTGCGPLMSGTRPAVIIDASTAISCRETRPSQFLKDTSFKTGFDTWVEECRKTYDEPARSNRR